MTTCNLYWLRYYSQAAKSNRDVAQFGSALDWGSRGRRFESCPPDQQMQRSAGFLAGLFILLRDNSCPKPVHDATR